MCVCGTWYPVVAGEDSDDDIGPQPQNLSGFTKGQSTGSVSTRLPVCVHGFWLGWNVCVHVCAWGLAGVECVCVCMCVHGFWLGWNVRVHVCALVLAGVECVCEWCPFLKCRVVACGGLCVQ